MDFNYDSYLRLIHFLIDKGYLSSLFLDKGDLSSKKTLFLRHDIDISIDMAVEMAKREYEEFGNQIRPTYFFMVTSDFYNIFSKKSVDQFNYITSLGYEIGLHFDETVYFDNELWDKESIANMILKEARILGEAIGKEIVTVSMHKPSKKVLRTDLNIPRMINTYSKFYFDECKYFSDSYHFWRENVYEYVQRNDPTFLQVLVHPFWYAEVSRNRRECFESYIKAGCDYRSCLIEDNVLPPGVTMKEAME